MILRQREIQLCQFQRGCEPANALLKLFDLGHGALLRCGGGHFRFSTARVNGIFLPKAP